MQHVAIHWNQSALVDQPPPSFRGSRTVSDRDPGPPSLRGEHAEPVAVARQAVAYLTAAVVIAIAVALPFTWGLARIGVGSSEAVRMGAQTAVGFLGLFSTLALAARGAGPGSAG